MRGHRPVAAALLCLAAAAEASAQPTLEELTAQIDAETTQLAGFRALLTDPDPARALAAMRAMLLSGDPVLSGMALEAGLTASSGVMRKVALEAFIAARPNLVASAELVEDAGTPESFGDWMRNNRYAMSGPTTGFIPIEVPPYIEEARCYGVGDACSVKLAGGDLSVLLGVSWHPNWAGFELAEGGQLVGSVLSYGGPVTLTIDLLGGAGQ